MRHWARCGHGESSVRILDVIFEKQRHLGEQNVHLEIKINFNIIDSLVWNEGQKAKGKKQKVENLHECACLEKILAVFV